MDKCVITRAVTVAGGRFAPGHLGELTQQVPFEMVDAVLEQTCRVQRRIRVLPARVAVYLLLAGCLFAELGYTQVWHRVAAGLGGLPVTVPTASAMTQARRRLGPAPLRELFFLLRGPSPGGARWRGLLVCAIDGTIMTVADSEANLAVYSKQRGGANGGSGYPMLRLLVLVSCGTRTVIDAVFGPVSAGETTYAPGLLGSLHAGMILLADRGFGAGFLAAQIAGTGADFLIRVRAGNGAPGLPVLRRLPDGSWLSRFGGVSVRVIDAEVTVTTSAGHATGGCPAGHHPDRPGPLPRRRPGRPVPRAVGSRERLLRAQVHHPRRPGPARPHPRRRRPGGLRPAGHLPGTAHRHRRRRRHRSRHRPRSRQLLRRPERCPQPGHLAAGVIAGPATDLAGKIGRLVLASLMPGRRLRTSPRVVKRAMSRYNAKGKVDRATRKAIITIAILGAPLTTGDEP